jgi:signal transduction histidine kinase
VELAGFVRSHRERILAEWRRAARPPGRAGGSGALALSDDLPRILDDLAAVVEASPAAGAALPPNVGALGLHPLASGFELDQAVGEYALLREVILRLWARTAPVHPLQPVQVLDAALDRAIASAVALHTAERKRSQDEQRATELHDRAIQQETIADLGARALAGDDVDALLGVAAARVAEVLGVDLAIVGEVVGDRLRVRAGSGWREGAVGQAELPLPSDSLPGLALARREPAVVEDVRATPGHQFAPIVASHGAVSGASVPLEHGGRHGVLSVYARKPRSFRSFDIQFLQAVGSLLGVALDRAQALAATRAGEVAARRGEERLHFLAEASALLASSLDVGRVAQRLTDLAVPRIADWCLLDLVATDGAIHAAAISSDDPNPLRLERVKEYRSTHPLRADAPYGIATVLRTGASLLLPHVSHEELRAIAPDEQYVRWVAEAGLRSILAVPLRGASATLGILSFGTSHSGRVLGEEERDLAQALAARAALALENARLYEEAQRAVRLREHVLAVVSHDLKSPLSAIGLTAQLLARKLAADPGVLRSLANIESAASHASALLRDLLDMASIQAGRLAVTAEPTDPGEIAGDALEQLAPVAQERGVTISLEGRGPPVLADRGRLVQVLGNLLGNAAKASARGSAVTLRLTEVAGGVRFEVVDTGVGIAPEDLPRIFEAYWSAQHAPGAPARERGSGLGLVIAKGILDAHGASLEVESTLGRGTTFSFTLPRG